MQIFVTAEMDVEPV